MEINERKDILFALVDEQADDLVRICSDLIKIPSTTKDQCESILEFVTSWLSMENIPFQVLRGPKDIPSIVIDVGNPDGPLVLMDGHNDVVSPGDLKKWEFSPYSGDLVGGLLLGRGTSDMKCGTGILLFIAKLLSGKQLDFKGHLRIFIVHDEEVGGEAGTAWLIDSGLADGGTYCLVPEPTSYNNVEVGQKGSIRVGFKMPGVKEGENYISPINRIIPLLKELQVIGDMKSNLDDSLKEVYDNSVEIIQRAFGIPGVEKAINHVGLRFHNFRVWEEEGEKYCEAFLAISPCVMVETGTIIEKINEIVQRHKADDVEITYYRCRESAYTDVNTDLVKSVVSNAELVTGKRVIPAWQWATSDCKFFRYRDIPSIQYGPAITAGIHSYNECVEIQEIINTCKVYLATMDDLTGFNL